LDAAEAEVSFTDHDPFNHVDVRFAEDSPRYWWECESCGGDGLRGEYAKVYNSRFPDAFAGWDMQLPQLASMMRDYRRHLERSHGDRFDTGTFASMM
jgi:hypothetical protein